MSDLQAHIRFPTDRDLAGFRFEQSAVDVAFVKAPHACEFIEQAHNVVLIGGPGTAKTHLATFIAGRPTSTITCACGSSR